jgi:methionine sulfoxide reductase heme-binding subunit
MTLWYLARSAGLTALIALSASTALGALMSGRSSALGRRVIVQYLHRSAALLGVGLLVLHVGSMVLDAKSGISLSTAVIPFSSGYRPLAVALGTVSLYLLLLLVVTGLARGRMTSSPGAVRAWRGIHLSAYALWALAILHGFFAGSDSDVAWVRVLYTVLIASVAAAVAVRLRSYSVGTHSSLAVRRAELTPVLVREGRR